MPDLYYCLTQELSTAPGERKKQEHLTGRALLAFCLNEQFGLTPDQIRIETGEFGKPWLPEYPEVQFNLSHCRGLVICATASVPVGVDCEKMRNISVPLIRRILTESEQETVLNDAYSNEERNRAFLRFWTLKEAYSKYIGSGITMDFKSVSFALTDTGTVQCSDPGVDCIQYDLDGEYQIALCSQKSDQRFSVGIHPVTQETLFPDI